MKLSLAISSQGLAAVWSSLASNSVGSGRNFFQKGAALAAFVALATLATSHAYLLPYLPYPFESLELYIDTPTMKIHHDKHHATYYVANINKATEGQPEPPIVTNAGTAISVSQQDFDGSQNNISQSKCLEDMQVRNLSL